MLETAKPIATEAQSKGWQVFAVGGFVRDSILGIDSKDLDLEVFGPKSVDELIEFLSQFGEVNAVGKSFGVLKLRVNGVDLDVSLPRTESKAGKGHKGFLVKSDGALTPQEAAERRDFTFNALMMSLPDRQTVDRFDGVKHIINKRLVHTSSSFADDPLRVLRGMQFCGRFNLTANRETVTLCQSLLAEFDTLAKERLWVEWEKWAAKSVKPSRGLVFLLRTGWITKFPELAAIVGIQQSSICHSEGSVWQHTKLVVDQASKIAKRERLNREDTVILLLSALCHDLGKAVSTTEEDGIIKAIGHEETGVELTESFLTSIDAPKEVIEKVCSVVKNHMSKPETSTGIKRLANRLPVSINLLTLLMEADTNGRKSQLDKRIDRVLSLREKARQIGVVEEKPKPILMGRHLLAMGFNPGIEMGNILRMAFDAQLNEEFEDLDGARKWVKDNTK